MSNQCNSDATTILYLDLDTCEYDNTFNQMVYNQQFYSAVNGVPREYTQGQLVKKLKKIKKGRPPFWHHFTFNS